MIEQALYKAQRGLCYLCAKALLDFSGNPNADLFPTVDHILPRASGGIRFFPNIALACRRCNNRKAETAPRPCEVLFGAWIYLVAEVNRTDFNGAIKGTFNNPNWRAKNPVFPTTMAAAFRAAGIAPPE